VAVRGDRAGPVQPLLDLLPLNGIHNGGDLTFGTDGTLFVTVGEAGNAANAQDPSSLGGKVLRLRPDGSPAEDPLPGPAYSMGLRNSFGICVDPSTGDLWETENGPSSDDEVNRIVAGGNYGWPDQLGPGGDPSRFVDPVVDHPRVIVPTGCAIWDGDLYYGAFDGAIRRVALPASAPARDEVVATVGAGITDLSVGPDGALYVATTAGIDRFAAPPHGPVAPPPATRATPSRSGSIGAVALAVAAVSAAALVLLRRRRLRSPPDA
jgi:glucose/arabinose dehydrogenase